jgi:hypothetical protein
MMADTFAAVYCVVCAFSAVLDGIKGLTLTAMTYP